MILFGVDQSQLNRLSSLLNGSATKIRNQVKIAINATAKKTKSEVNSQVRERLKVSKAAVDKVLTVKSATETHLGATVTLTKTKRISIKEFKPRQIGKRKAKTKKAAGTKKIGRPKGSKNGASKKKKVLKKRTSSKKAGVTYAMQPGKRGFIPGAFIGGGTANNHVYTRTTKNRLPIQKQYGPSAWGVIVVNNKVDPIRGDARKELKKQIERRIRFIALKQSGGLRGKQK